MKLNKNPRVALVHDYLNQYGGAEKTLEKIMELFPKAPIYTGILDLSKLPKKFETRNIKTPAMNFVLKRVSC